MQAFEGETWIPPAQRATEASSYVGFDNMLVHILQVLQVLQELLVQGILVLERYEVVEQVPAALVVVLAGQVLGRRCWSLVGNKTETKPNDRSGHLRRG